MASSIEVTQKRPLATYRLQFNPAFGFRDAVQLVPYLYRLGITHLYSSPILKARQGSSHGYDVVDPKALNHQLGSEEEFRWLTTTLHEHNMGLVLDIVPNHMAATGENPYWDDVLTYGPSSPFAGWFDIDWRLPDPHLWGRVLVPVLGEPLSHALQQQQLKLTVCDGRLRISYFELSFPLDPATLPQVLNFGLGQLREQLGADHPEFRELVTLRNELHALGTRTHRMRRRLNLPYERSLELLNSLRELVRRSSAIQDWLRQTAEAFAAEPGHYQRMRRLLDAQSYRLAYWRRGARVINYRRFFDINDLVAVRQEDPDVFEQTHSLIFQWIREGLLDGLRIDHIDGLRDPGGYLERLAGAVAHHRGSESHFPIFVEKILAHDERLPAHWPVAGTTGYEFLNQAEALFLHPEGTAEIEEQYGQLVRQPPHYREIVRWAKRRVLKSELSAFVGQLARRLQSLAEDDAETAELTVRELAEAVREFVVCLPVYRTYVDEQHPALSEADHQVVETALAGVRERQRAPAPAIDFLAGLLLEEDPEKLEKNRQQKRVHFIQRLQELTGPAAAKGIEDTALYRYVPLVSRNEVGGEPDAPLHNAAEALHRGNQYRATAWPETMLTVTTHDTKRSADVRSRLDVLSEWPKLFMAHVSRWRRWNASFRKRIRGRMAPDVNTEYLLYQTLLGIWPPPPADNPEHLPVNETLQSLCHRTEEYMEKAVREAKKRTSWINPDPDYEAALKDFIRQVLLPEDAATSQFLSDLNQFVGRIARQGMWNALARSLLHWTAPGIPDLYQGEELWNHVLVDPDNRRAVDFELRDRKLTELSTAVENTTTEERIAWLRELLHSPEDGRMKLYVIHAALQARQQWPQLFLNSAYRTVEMDGPAGEHLFAFARQAGNQMAVVVVPRLLGGILSDPRDLPLGEPVWGETAVRLPEDCPARDWRSVLTGEQFTLEEATPQFRVAELLGELPVALLIGN